FFSHNAGELRVISFIREKCTKKRLKKLLPNTLSTHCKLACYLLAATTEKLHITETNHGNSFCFHYQQKIILVAVFALSFYFQIYLSLHIGQLSEKVLKAW
ncbi:hypothetical protein Zm00014a_025907, partial [Zea mays]